MTPAERYRYVVGHVACFAAMLALVAIFLTALTAPDQDHHTRDTIYRSQP